MEILIIGAGSLGCLFGAKLALSGVKVNAIVSQRRRDSLQTRGLHLQPLSGPITEPLEKFQIIPSKDKLPPDSLQKIDLCIIAAKTYDLDQVCREYSSIISAIPIICLLQNGVGNEEIASKYFPVHSIYRIITSNGALFSEPDTVIHTGQGETYFCPWGNISPPRPISEFIHHLDRAGIPADLSDNPQEIIWRKAIVNIGINAFGALTGLSNGELLKVISMTEVMRKTIEEAILIALETHIPLDPNFDYVSYVFKVVDRTLGNKNSMLQDVMKESRTEIDFLNARVVQLGENVGIGTPYNSVIVALVKGKEHSYLYSSQIS